MRNTLVAVALACAFPAVYAQSSVTVYGILDGGVEVLDAGSETVTRLQGAGMWSGNRFGIRGSENLGGGYSAIFTLEGRFSLDTGTLTYNESLFWCRLSGATTAPVCPGVTIVPGTAIATLPSTSPTYQAVLGGLNSTNNALLQAITTVNGAGAIFDRQSWLGMVTPYGAVLLGRQYTPGYEILNRFNVMGDASALSFGQGYNTPGIRMNNALVYRAELKGFAGMAMYSFGGSETPASARNERVIPPVSGDDMWGLDLMYNALDRHLLNCTLWNYTASNRNDAAIGDGWNQEDLSVFSRDQLSDANDVNSGGRALEGFVRPFVRACQGTLKEMRFDRASSMRSPHSGFLAFLVRGRPSEKAVPEITQARLHQGE